jgi:hypothetical protein
LGTGNDLSNSMGFGSNFDFNFLTLILILQNYLNTFNR